MRRRLDSMTATRRLISHPAPVRGIFGMDKVLGKKNMKRIGLAAWCSVACNQNIAADAVVMPAMFWFYATL